MFAELFILILVIVVFLAILGIIGKIAWALLKWIIVIGVILLIIALFIL